MKNQCVVVGLCFALTIALVSRAAAQPKSIFFGSNALPPPNGTYISPAQYHALYANGIVISNVTHRAFTESLPPPPSGTSSTHTFKSELDFDISFNNGGTFTRASAPATVNVNVQAVGTGSGGQQTYNTEMLQLNVSGGTLPNGVMIRESPTRSSTGQTIITPAPGGFMISSFFDIFTEATLDGGQTWSSSGTSGHVELRVDPLLVPPMPEANTLVPPPTDRYATPTQYQALFASGVIIKNVGHKFASPTIDPFFFPAGGLTVTQHFQSTIDCQLSLNGGQTFSPLCTTGVVAVALQKASSGPPALFDTEMTQLDATLLSGPTGSVMIRESPSRPSYGGTAMQVTSDGSYRINSFFDVFVEVSLDGGQTWSGPTNGPSHVELQRESLIVKSPVGTLPPTNGQFNFPGVIRYPGGIVLSNFINRGLQPPLPPPLPGQSQLQEFNSFFDVMFSMDSGQTFNPASGQATGMLTISNTSPVGTTGALNYDTELTQLSISGGGLPAQIMVRESPSKASLGRTSVVQDPGASGGYRVSSFFDVFTELSMDGGQTWNPGVADPSTIPLVPNPPFVPYTITCPSDIAVYASTPKGAVVNFSLAPIVFFPDCPFCCLSATCTPPSGSLFPIGTTTVNCMGSDGCGERPTCSFKITVNQPFIYAGLADNSIGNSVLLLNTNIVGTNLYAPPWLVVSNISASGQDGFHLFLGEAESAVLNFLPFPTTSTTGMVIRATGAYGSNPTQPMGIGNFIGGDTPKVSADFSTIGASSVTMELRDGQNQFLYSISMPNAALVDVNNLFPPPCTNTTTTYTYSESVDHICYRFCKYGCNCLGTNCYIERIACFRPDIASLPYPNFLTDLELKAQTAAVPGVLTIQSEELGLFGLPHQTIGQATLEAHPGVLLVNNIGASGQDGILVDLKNTGQFDMTLAPTMIANGGACWAMAVYGNFNGVPNSPLGAVSLTHSVGPGGGCIVAGDFRPMGSTQVVVEVYQGSQFIGSNTSSNGFLGFMPSHGNLINCGALLRPMAGLRLKYDSSFIFNPINGTSQLSGDQIRILALNAGGQLQGLSQFALESCDLGQFAILGEWVQPTITSPFKNAGGVFVIGGQGAAGMTYRLEGALSLESAWTSITTTTSGLDGTFHLMDSQASSPSMQFYRIFGPQPLPW